MLLWEEYAAANPMAYKYTSFCVKYREFAKAQQRSMRQVHIAGEKLFVDFAGDAVPIVDAATGEITRAQIFVAALGASDNTYACATPRQTNANTDVAQTLEANRATVTKWRSRYMRDRIAGLYDELRPGRPRTVDDERVAHSRSVGCRGELQQIGACAIVVRVSRLCARREIETHQSDALPLFSYARCSTGPLPPPGRTACFAGLSARPSRPGSAFRRGPAGRPGARC